MKQKQFPTHTFNKLTTDPNTKMYLDKMHSECEKYGILIGVFSEESSIHTEYEKQALKYIEQGKEIPDVLKVKLRETLPERLERNKRYVNNDIEMTEAEAEKILGIKL